MKLLSLRASSILQGDMCHPAERLQTYKLGFLVPFLESSSFLFPYFRNPNLTTAVVFSLINKRQEFRGDMSFVFFFPPGTPGTPSTKHRLRAKGLRFTSIS